MWRARRRLVRDFEPNPDYYVARLWREHMGAAVLAPTVSGAAWDLPAGVNPPFELARDAPAFLRVHAHCWKGAHGNGSVALAWAAVGEDDDGDAYELDVSAWAGDSRRLEWSISSADANAGVRSSRVACNGAPLYVADDPAPHVVGLEPRELAAGGAAASLPVRVAPASVGFVVLPDARLPACVAPFSVKRGRKSHVDARVFVDAVFFMCADNASNRLICELALGIVAGCCACLCCCAGCCVRRRMRRRRKTVEEREQEIELMASDADERADDAVDL